MSETRQKKLREFLRRRHPLYDAMAAHWAFLEATYDGGRSWFDSNIFQYVKEGDEEFASRTQRAYRFNHTREVVDLVDKYIFKMEVHRNTDEAPDCLTAFWRQATLRGQPIKEFMKSVSKAASIYGRAWVVVDTNRTEEVKTRADEKAAGVRTYAYIVGPEHVLDMSYDEQGELNWILIHEVVRDDADPLESSGTLTDRYRLWTREDSRLFVAKRQGSKVAIEEDSPRPHDLGRVPVIPADNVITDEKYVSPSMIADVAYLDRACANYLSNLDAIIQDQTFSQLAMPAQGLSPGEDAYKKLLEMGTKRIFLFDGEGGAQPFYLSPDVKQAELILKVVNKIINEIYHSIGLAGERTKEDNALGIDNSSGVAKAYDFERVNSLLASKADSLESVENELCGLVALYAGEEAAVEELAARDKRLVLYPDDFDVRGLYDEFEIAARLALIEAPDGMRRAQMDKVIDKLFPQLTDALKESLEAELQNWPPKIDPLAPGAPGAPGAQAPAGSSIASLKKHGTNTLSNKLVKGNNGKV
jgi:hypothetical protein